MDCGMIGEEKKTSRALDECTCPTKNPVEHRFRQPSRERILLARVEGAQQRNAVCKLYLDPVSEFRAPLEVRPSEFHETIDG